MIILYEFYYMTTLLNDWSISRKGKDMKYLLACALLLPSVVFAAGTMPPKAVVCQACHGEGGGKGMMAGYPMLKGQDEQYLVNAITAYKKGGRTGGMAAVMAGQAMGLSDAEIKELAAYYASQ
ncbi:MAG: cytochrome c553 [Candidatus Pseudothioglobus sp.]|jgi:cytochrome c553